ncbi:MAG: aminopeptidase P family protein [Gemmatimonadota bacterium]
MPADRRPERLAALRGLLEREVLGGLLIQHLPNIRYLTGFTGSAALLLIRPADAVLISDFRYASQAPQEAGDLVRVEIDQHSPWQRLKKLLAITPIETLGYEGHIATVRDAERIAGTTTGRLVPAPELVERLRAAKAVEEVGLIREAAALAESALAVVLPTVRVGETEIAIGARLELELRLRGSEWHPFQTIVASGARAALPHARTGTRQLEKGDWLLLDFGAQVGGYCADITRTVVVGARASERQRAVYETVRTAQSRAIQGIRAGQPAREADALARDVIVQKGFGEAFGHSLGHGLGLEVHEAPRVAPSFDDPLPAHAVVTIEPGIYLPGWGGVRLEDDVHLDPAGPVCLSSNQTELLELD